MPLEARKQVTLGMTTANQVNLAGHPLQGLGGLVGIAGAQVHQGLGNGQAHLAANLALGGLGLALGLQLRHGPVDDRLVAQARRCHEVMQGSKN